MKFLLIIVSFIHPVKASNLKFPKFTKEEISLIDVYFEPCKKIFYATYLTKLFTKMLRFLDGTNLLSRLFRKFCMKKLSSLFQVNLALYKSTGTTSLSKPPPGGSLLHTCVHLRKLDIMKEFFSRKIFGKNETADLYRREI